jgi:hypothetical protein
VRAFIAETINVRHFLSKLLAGGLSAGVILLWWPLVFPSDSLESWLIRGICWTFCFELMMHSFAPLEEALWKTRAARTLAAQAQASVSKLPGDTARKRVGLRSVVAGVALLIPVALLTTAPAERIKPKQASTEVRQVTQVKRIVRVERRSVTVPRAALANRAPAPEAGTSVDTVAGAPATAPAQSPARRGTTISPRTDEPRTTSPRRPASSRGSDSTADTPAADSPAPAADSTASVPSAEPRQRSAVSG